MEEKSRVATKLKRASDIIGDGSINFYPDLEKVDLEDVLSKDLILMDAKVLRDWPSEYSSTGKADWCLLYFQEEATGREFTTKCGGVVLVKRVADLLARKVLPVIACIKTQGDAEKPYYNIV